MMETIGQGSEQNILVQRLSTNFLYQVPLTVVSTEEKALSTLRLFTWYKITGAFVRKKKRKKERKTIKSTGYCLALRTSR